MSIDVTNAWRKGNKLLKRIKLVWLPKIFLCEFSASIQVFYHGERVREAFNPFTMSVPQTCYEEQLSLGVGPGCKWNVSLSNCRSLRLSQCMAANVQELPDGGFGSQLLSWEHQWALKFWPKKTMCMGMDVLESIAPQKFEADNHRFNRLHLFLHQLVLAT